MKLSGEIFFAVVPVLDSRHRRLYCSQTFPSIFLLECWMQFQFILRHYEYSDVDVGSFVKFPIFYPTISD
jgi:hypothetical protein